MQEESCQHNWVQQTQLYSYTYIGMKGKERQNGGRGGEIERRKEWVANKLAIKGNEG